MASVIGKIDYILNIASESHVDRSIECPRDFVENNVALMLTMLEYARQYPVEKFVQISTDEVYGPAKDHDHEEWETLLPSNPYSASKAAQENIAFSYWRTFGVPVIMTNTMNIIGELQDPEKFVPMTIKRVLAGETVTVHGSADGKTIGSRYYLHARNQADALLFILQNVPPLVYGGDVDRPSKYNIVGEKEVTNLEMAQLIARYLNKPLRYQIVDFHSSRPGHDLRYGLNGQKMADLGWKAPMSFEESLKTTVDWTVKHPEWLK
jgi:dTDP-glucose 4,6-dehydratase